MAWTFWYFHVAKVLGIQYVRLTLFDNGAFSRICTFYVESVISDGKGSTSLNSPLIFLSKFAKLWIN